MSDILDSIKTLAGPLRATTFLKAAEFVLSLPRPSLIETGCYRGSGCDGQSTRILALLARETGGAFTSFDLHQHNIDKAREFLASHGLSATFVTGDSAETLRRVSAPVDFAYLDSYDFEEHKWIDAQAHQLVETGILLPKMAARSAFLLDDCDLPLGGKAGLSLPSLILCGYTYTAQAYQILLTREAH